MSMLDNTCDAFIDVLASKAPVPGGGGAAAMGGAIGMALSNMVGNLTVGKKKYADVEDEVKDLLDQGDAIIARLKDAMLHFSAGVAQQDDMTVVMVKAG